jgi:carbon monoxide dehydrogenase subunit G
MQLTEQFDLPFQRVAVWTAFQNLALLVQCLPGANLTSPADQVPLEMTFQLKMGPVVAAFAGQGGVTYEPANFCGSFHGQGTDRKNNSRVKGEARFALLEVAETVTTVQVVVEFTLTGALAQFGRLGIVREIATAITAQFADNLKREMSVSGNAFVEAPAATAGNVASADGNTPKLQPVLTATDAPSITVSTATSGKPEASLNLPALLWKLLVERVKRAFR